jgi:PAS domain S-box-containing protein
VQDSNQHNDELGLTLEHLSLALSATGLGVWERNLETDRVTWSDAMHRVFGRPKEQFSGNPDQVLSFVHPEDRAAFRRAYTTAVRGSSDFFEQEFRIVRPDGEVRWVHRRGRVRRAPDGQARSVLGVALDITDRKLAEETNARLAAIVSAADDAIIGLTPDGTIISWNPAAERLFGYPASEAVGQSAQILYPDNAENEFQSIYAGVRGGEHFRFDSTRLRRDGVPVSVSVAITPVIGKAGYVVGASAIIRDVSERKRTEQRLVETLALLLQTNNQRQLALAAGGMGTFEMDLEHDEVIWSDELYAQVGIERTTGPMSNADAERFVHTDDLERVRSSRASAFESGDTYENEFRIVRPDGEIRWVYVRAQALANGAAPAKAYGVSMDITERKEHEAHVRFLMSEVSHRSKNLLAVVQAIAAQTSRGASSPTAFAQDFGARLKSLASSLDLLVQQEWLGVSTRGLVQSQLGHYAEQTENRVSFIGPDVMLSPMAAQYLGMALHELSTNASKYGALSVEDGRVAIEWRVTGPRGQQRFQMWWREENGPPVETPKAMGFGHLVIERMAAEALHGEVKLEYAPEGLRWFIDADAAATLRDVPTTASAAAPAPQKKGPVQGDKTRGD